MSRTRLRSVGSPVRDLDRRNAYVRGCGVFVAPDDLPHDGVRVRRVAIAAVRPTAASAPGTDAVASCLDEEHGESQERETPPYARVGFDAHPPWFTGRKTYLR